MNTLWLEKIIAERYDYFPLPYDISQGMRKIYADNTPQFLSADTSQNLYSICGTLLCRGYNRIVVGDYGAFVEFTPEQANKCVFIVQPGEEYRITDKKYSKNIKYHWYTVADGSDVKLYFQRRAVSYADYKRGMYYVSVHEVTNHEN